MSARHEALTLGIVLSKGHGPPIRGAIGPLSIVSSFFTLPSSDPCRHEASGSPFNWTYMLATHAICRAGSNRRYQDQRFSGHHCPKPIVIVVDGEE